MGEKSGTAEPAIDPELVRAQVRRLLADRSFQASKRYSDLLTYVVDRTLEGRFDSLKERIIGIEIFERPLDYDTSIDAIVRVAAAEVRKRLAKYYHEETHAKELRIDLPVRSYVPEFRLPVEAAREPTEEPPLFEQSLPKEQISTPATVPDAPSSGFRIWTLVALAACLLMCAWAAEHLYVANRPLNRFWAPMSNSAGQPLIAIGSLSWLTSSEAQADARRTASADNMTYVQLIAHQQNYPVADITAASALTSFLAHRGSDSVIRLSDSASLSDLHGSPVIVLGSFPNEWALRLGAHLPFRFRQDGDWQGIETANDSGHRWMVNIRSPYEQVTSDYALITRAVDQNTGQWWIGISGATVLSTNAAERVIVDPHEMAAIAAGFPKNWDRKNLQFVIEVKMVKGSPGASQVVAAKTW